MHYENDSANFIRDVHGKAADRDLIDKMLNTQVELRYDERYIKELIK